LPQNVFLSYSNDQLEWTAATVLNAPPDSPVLVATREVRDRGISELLIHSPDYDGLFAAVTMVIDEIGLDVLGARVANTTAGKSYDLFQLMDGNAQSLNDVDCHRLKQRLRKVLGKEGLPKPVARKLPRRLRPFKSALEIHFSAAQGGERTLMDLACSDRPGLLSDICSVLVACGIRIHDSKITTMGDRVEDAFILSDQHNEPLSRDTRAQLLNSLTEKLA
jgi:[protein-PII] uridylyltransferase